MSQSNCPRGKRLFGSNPCKFEPRYDYEGPSDALKDHCSTQMHLSNADKAKLTEKRTYIKDVCVNCGRSIVR